MASFFQILRWVMSKPQEFCTIWCGMNQILIQFPDTSQRKSAEKSNVAGILRIKCGPNLTIEVNINEPPSHLTDLSRLRKIEDENEKFLQSQVCPIK